MKITTTQYANLLLEAFGTSDKNDQKTLVKGIAKLIRQNRDITKLDDIENSYKLFKKRNSGQIEGIVYTANELSNNELTSIQKAIAIKKDILDKSISLKNEINSDIKGGFVVKFENEILDGSLDSKIDRIKKALVS